jgi:hypothetical protein
MVKVPVIQGVIRRRVLLNYRVDPGVVARLLPSNFRPKLHHGHAIAGICLIRLEEIRPKGLPKMVGLTSENTAHRFAVEWDAEGQRREGVFVPRRDTDSCLNTLAGGRLFPGVHNKARFDVSDAEGSIAMNVFGDGLLVEFEAKESQQLMAHSVFSSVQESSEFFEKGCIGYSARPDSCTLDGMVLKIDSWKVSALDLEYVRSSYFDDQSIFPAGCIAFDHALLMRDIPHEWHAEADLLADT